MLNTKSPDKETKKVFIEAFYIMFYGLIALLFIRALILNHSFNQIWDISILFLIVSIYITIKLAYKGQLHSSQNSNSFNIKKNIGKNLVTSILTYLILIFTKTRKFSLLELIVFVVSFCFIGFILEKISYKVTKKQKKVEK